MIVRYSKCQTKASVEGFIPTITYIYFEPNTGSELNHAGENKTKKSRELETNFNSKCQTKPSVQGFTSPPRPHLTKGSKYSRYKRLNKSKCVRTTGGGNHVTAYKQTTGVTFVINYYALRRQHLHYLTKVIKLGGPPPLSLRSYGRG